VQEALQITCRDFELAEWMEKRIRGEVNALERYYPRILGCRVALERAHRRHASGNRFRVRIDLAVPGGEIVVSHLPSLHARLKALEADAPLKQFETEPARRQLIVAIDEAFETMRRRLQDFAARQQGDVKTHEPPAHGRVVRLDIAEGYGFIEARDGHEVYFHRNSVLDDRFDDLVVGSDVAFAEEPGERGPQASTVRLLGSRHYVTA
jgi:cold shock CspA family protein/ribosome-associated translation inhibitor RaiA